MPWSSTLSAQRHATLATARRLESLSGCVTGCLERSLDLERRQEGGWSEIIRGELANANRMLSECEELIRGLKEELDERSA